MKKTVLVLCIVILGLTGCAKTDGFMNEYSQIMDDYVQEASESTESSEVVPYTSTNNTWSWLLLQ